MLGTRNLSDVGILPKSTWYYHQPQPCLPEDEKNKGPKTFEEALFLLMPKTPRALKWSHVTTKTLRYNQLQGIGESRKIPLTEMPRSGGQFQVKGRPGFTSTAAFKHFPNIPDLSITAWRPSFSCSNPPDPQDRCP